MFAIALWDVRRQELVLARDRLGIKPLYLARLAEGVAFGSEPKALLEHPEIAREPNLVALHHYLSLKNIPAPLSAFRAIEQLRNGEARSEDQGHGHGQGQYDSNDRLDRERPASASDAW